MRTLRSLRSVKCALLGIAATLLLAGCGSPYEPSRAAVGLQIVSRVAAMFPGQAESLLVALDSLLVTPGSVQWQSLDTSVFAVDTAGVIRARGLGVGAIIGKGPRNSDTIAIQVIEPPTGRIVFVGIERESDQPQLNGLFEIQADGSGLRALSAFFTQVGPPAFSPDGSMLAVPVGSPPQVFIVRSDGNGTLYQPNNGMACGASTPAWSPDSRMIAFSSCASGRFEVWVSALDGSQRRQVTSFSGSSVQEMAFLPEGNALIVSAHDPNPPPDGTVDLYRVDLTTTQTQRLAATTEAEVSPFVDNRTSRLFFGRTVSDAPGSRPKAEATAVFASDTALNSITQLTPTEPLGLAGFAPQAQYPRISPDGKWMVFAFNMPRFATPGLRLGDPRIGVSAEIYVMSLQDHLMVRLTHLMLAVQPSWNTQ